MSSILMAMNQYKAEYAVYPPGSSEDILQLLAGENLKGKNPRKVVFLMWNKKHNTMIDPWETPYRIIYIDPDTPQIQSAGKNRLFGDADDARWPDAQKK